MAANLPKTKEQDWFLRTAKVFRPVKKCLGRRMVEKEEEKYNYNLLKYLEYSNVQEHYEIHCFCTVIIG